VPQLIDGRTGSNCQYSLSTILITAYTIFLFCKKSFNQFSRQMEFKFVSFNMKSIFNIIKPPGVDQIRNVLDMIDPTPLNQIFIDGLEKLKKDNKLAAFQNKDKNFIIAIDGTSVFFFV
jgi:hypothetical protein